ncbi:oxoeicosanoid receptor 1-like [Chanos chanos]|uniref:Oxoeicosanoid receptor 1-like n=1 Tax=Chanos chanos TaxID=29144 RepID=A0A6J2VG02_CHACN|nr:oxoeicosanoid receptor 1-like [Chanos chanos]
MMNNTTDCVLSEPQTIASDLLPPILILEFILALPGNAVAFWGFCCRQQPWTSNLVYLVNLMLSDFLLLIGLPLRIDTLLRGEEWIFGDALCRLNLFMLAINRSASIAFMTVITVDRYFKILYPFHSISQLSARRAVISVCLVWITVILLRLPLLTTSLLNSQSNDSSKLMCRSFGRNTAPTGEVWLHYMLYLLEFLLPFLLVLFCSVRIYCFLRGHRLRTHRRVRRAMRLVLMVIIVFCICFLPSVLSVIASLALQRLQHCASLLIAGQMFSLSEGLTYLNSALDPIIYGFASPIFRKALRASLNFLGPWRTQISQEVAYVSPQTRSQNDQ